MTNKPLYSIAIIMALTAIMVLALYWRKANVENDFLDSNATGSRETTVLQERQPEETALTSGTSSSNLPNPRELPEKFKQEAAIPNNDIEGQNQTSTVSSHSADSEAGGLSVPEHAPFPVSESIERQCAELKDMGFECSYLPLALKKIEEEAIDPQWSWRMEARLRATLKPVVTNRFRALACRQTVCVFETEGGYLSQAQWDPLEEDVQILDYTRAYEETGNGGRVRVHLWVFERRRR